MKCSYVYSYDTKDSVAIVPTDTPVFVMFNGYKTLSSKIALHDLRKYADLLDKNNINAKMYGISYTIPNICSTMPKKFKEFVLLSTLFMSPRYFRKYIDNISDVLVVPRITSEQGQKLPVAVAEKNMRNLTLFAYSYGAHVVNCLYKNIDKRMKDLHYTDDEINKILKQMVVIAQSPVRILYNNKITSLNFVSAKDIRVLYRGAFNGISQLTYYPEYNTMVQPQVFNDEYISEKLKSNIDVEHILWEYCPSKHVKDYTITELLRTVLCSATKSEQITKHTALLQSDTNYSVQHIKNHNFFMQKNLIKSYITRFMR